MSKPVTDVNFWKDRIQSAAKQGREFWSVYITRDSDWQHIFETHKRILRDEVEPGKRVLDAGCGYGRMAKLFEPKDYIGVDLSPEFIQTAKEKNPKHRFEVGRLEALPFTENFFDVAFCISIKEMIIENIGLQLWQHMEKELKRVAKKVLILEYTNPEVYETVE